METTNTLITIPQDIYFYHSEAVISAEIKLHNPDLESSSTRLH